MKYLPEQQVLYMKNKCLCKDQKHEKTCYENMHLIHHKHVFFICLSKCIVLV